MTKILLVEDDQSLREIYGIRLTAEGYEIASADDGEAALALAVKERPDLIISDVMMPKISGFDMLDILRSTPETANIKVIMMTALSADDQKARGESLGADRFLVKSQVGIEDVVNAVHEVLNDTNGIPATAVTATPTTENMMTQFMAAPAQSPAQPVAQAQPAMPAAQVQPVAQAQPVVSAPSVSPAQPISQAQPVMPTQPVTPAQPPINNPNPFLGNKFLAEQTGVSRREADNLIADGRVKINQEVAVLGRRFDETRDEVFLDDQKITERKGFTYLILNKPVGYVCSKKRQGDTPTLFELLPEKYQGLKTVGRLDKDSSGLILLTNDGDFAFSMTHPKFFKIKSYIVKLNRPLAPLHQQMISDMGIDLPDGKSKLFLKKEESDPSGCTFLVEMSEGRNRQIRRTFLAVGYKVVELHRIEFGRYTLENLKDGEFKEVEKR